MFTRINKSGPEVYRFPRIDDLGFKTFVSGRGGGVSQAPFTSLNTDLTRGDNPSDVKQNMEMIKDAAGVKAIWTPRQVHGDLLILVTDTFPDVMIEADAVATNIPGVAIAVRTADCLPVILVDPVTKTVAAIHAGRKGTELSIASKTVKTLEKELDVKAKNLHAGLGPCIRSCCYEVDEKTALYFHERCGAREGRLIDIAAANIDQLTSAGLEATNIYDCGICASCESHRFYSHRKDKGATGRFISGVAII
ncbi:FIG00003370: Multicopper polyphenol oxidase [hydrothermal vent metagenome]|uniref:FIG00003370: Multicopper polyphenol oxidase n=1 Tax=hydrothermal vent metagenome TaxID=652676 RepID=A0A3B1BJB0_9ZZZZ